MTEEWCLMCWDGCALTIWDNEDSAIRAFRDHRTIGHRVALFAPGTVRIPGYKYPINVTE